MELIIILIRNIKYKYNIASINIYNIGVGMLKYGGVPCGWD